MSAVPNDTSFDRNAIAPSRALVPFVPRRADGVAWLSLRPLALAGVFGLMLGAGGVAAYGLRHHMPWSGTPDAAQATASAATVHHLQDQIGRLENNLAALKGATEAARADDTVRGLKRSVEAMKQDVEQVRASGSAGLAQLAAKIDKVDRDPAPRLADITTRLDRIERAAKPVAEAQPQRPVDPSGHADRPAPLTTGSIPTQHAVYAALPPAAAKPVVLPPVKPSAVAAKPPAIVTARAETTQVPASAAKPLPRSGESTVDGWVVRDVYDGMALVEARNGGLREIEPGVMLPGAGEVRAIERRGRGWVVVTSRGVIDNDAF